MRLLVLGICFLLLLSACDLEVIRPSPSSNLTATHSPTLAPTVTASLSPRVTLATTQILPTLPVRPIQTCPNAPTSRLIIQERGRVTDDNNERLNIRQGPGTNYDLVTRMEARDVFFVLDGPACSGDYTWYRVRYRAFEGWMAEGDFEIYYAEPYLPS